VENIYKLSTSVDIFILIYNLNFVYLYPKNNVPRKCTIWDVFQDCVNAILIEIAEHGRGFLRIDFGRFSEICVLNRMFSLSCRVATTGPLNVKQ